jgi:hypothetical protein
VWLQILEQERRNGDDLAVIKQRLDRIESRLDSVDGGLARIESRLDGLDRAFKDFAKNVPAIVGDAARQALRESERAREEHLILGANRVPVIP